MLPNWVTSNKDSLTQEAADYVGLSPEEKLAIVATLCRDAVKFTQLRPDAERVYAYRERLSDDTKALLSRLRDAYRAAQRR